jgi:hypothetical protein
MKALRELLGVVAADVPSAHFWVTIAEGTQSDKSFPGNRQTSLHTKFALLKAIGFG